MKTIVKRSIRDEKGAAMFLVLILLLIGGLIATPLLAHMGTGLIAGEIYEKRTAELYAADAGVEDALWRIQNHVPEVAGLTQCNQYWSYNITDASGGVAEVNDKRMEVTITLVNNVTFTYRVVSTATGDGSGTEVEAYVIGASAGGNYSGLMDNVLTSQNGIELSPNVEVNPEEGEHAPVDYYGGVWPPPGVLSDWYWQDVEDETPYEFGTIDLEGVDMELGPLYRGGGLDIMNSIKTDPPPTLTLTGTIYITGDTLIGSTLKDFTLDLNGHTIFVASDTTGQNALTIGGRCTIEGPGIIIAVGDIYFAPKGDVGSEGSPVFVFSVSGETQTQPQGDFYGSVAGSVVVDIQPGTSMNYPEEEGWYAGLNFPIGTPKPEELVYSIFSWEVNQL